MPPYDPRAFIKLMFWSISFLLICTYLFGNENGDLSGEIYPTDNVKVIEVLEKIEQLEKDGDKTYWNKITEVKPKNAADQYCYVKVIIKESNNHFYITILICCIFRFHFCNFIPIGLVSVFLQLFYLF